MASFSLLARGLKWASGNRAERRAGKRARSQATSSLIESLESRLLFSAGVSSNITILPGPAQAVFITTWPVINANAGEIITPAITVDVEDAFGNLCTTDASIVTLGIASGPDGASVNGQTSIQVVGGVATFSGVSFTEAGQYTLSVSDPEFNTPDVSPAQVQPAISSFKTITVNIADLDAPSQLAFASQPANATAGVAQADPITVDVEDASGQILFGDGSTVKLKVKSTVDGSIVETLTATAVNGVATFSDLTLTRAGDYKLKAVDGSLTPAKSSDFTITAAAAAKLKFAVQPSNVIAGHAINPDIIVKVKDAFGNVVTNNDSTISLTAELPSPPPDLTFYTVTADAIGGVATFTNINGLQTTGQYTFQAFDDSLSPAISSSFKVKAAAPANVVFNLSEDVPFMSENGPPTSIVIEDKFGNICTSDTSAITLSIASGPDGAILSGTLTVTPVNGFANVSDLMVNALGDYTLRATGANGLTGVSDTFVVEQIH